MYEISRYDKNKYNIKTRLYYDFDLTYVLGDWDEMKTMIKDDVLTNKRIKVLSSKQKEQEKKMKIEAQIKAAAEKLAKLQAKLA